MSIPKFVGSYLYQNRKPSGKSGKQLVGASPEFKLFNHYITKRNVKREDASKFKMLIRH